MAWRLEGHSLRRPAGGPPALARAAADRSGTLDATNFRSDCTQLPFGPRAFKMRTTPSEDCLYLNARRPAGAGEKLPVIVWIYGGGWVIGGTSAPVYSGAELAKRGVLVASLNYRIGHFGFFAHPQLTRENADDGRFFNYGTLDQIAALEWIRRNIAAFGGDPTTSRPWVRAQVACPSMHS